MIKGRRWVRKAPSERESLISAMAGVAVGIGAGLVTFYLGRLYLPREPSPERPPSPVRAGRSGRVPTERRLPPAGGSTAG